MSIEKQFYHLSKFQYFLLSLLLFSGLFFRFANLESKVFWVDEIATLVRASGYTITELSHNLSQQNLLDFHDLIAYQTITPERNFTNVWQALIKSPEHAPLYFIFTRLWMEVGGDSIATIRSLSVILSLLIFPALYWLCQELFKKPLIGYLAIALMSISPFQVAYAQEARPYSLWTAAILFTSASFLRAIRLNNIRSWLLYSISLILGLYTSLFQIYIAIFQGIYLLCSPIKNKLKVIYHYLLFSCLALIAFLPWIIVIIQHLNLLQENTSWMRGNFNLIEIIAVFIGTVLLIFGDLPISQDSDPVLIAMILIIIVISYLTLIIFTNYFRNKIVKFIFIFTISGITFWLANYIHLDLTSIIGAIVGILILSLSGYSLYYIIAHTNHDRWLFIICLIASLPLPLLIIDIINQGQVSTAPRYLIPLQLGIIIAVAYTISSKIITNHNKYLWQFILSGFLILGIFSCIRNLNLSPFYQKGRNINNPAIAQIINQKNNPLLIAELDNTMDALSLAYDLAPQTRYKIINSRANIKNYFNSFSNVFILKPTNNLINELEQESNLDLQQVYKSHLFSTDEIPLDLWQIKNNH